MELEDFPKDLRVKLDEESEQRLWNSVDERGGVRDFCSLTGFSESKVYNWRSHQEYYPVEFVLEILEDPTSQVTAFKGGGRSLPVENLELPLPVSDELLTRVDASVVVNDDGVPIYRSREASLVERFRELLADIGDVPVSVYRRGTIHELRYPKHLHRVLEREGFTPVFAALVDEKGVIQDGRVSAGGESVDVEEFSGRLHSRDRRLELAIERDDRGEIEELIGEEARKVREAFG